MESLSLQMEEMEEGGDPRKKKGMFPQTLASL